MQAGERGDEADGGDRHGAVGLRGEQFAVQFVAFHIGAVVADGALEHRHGVGGAGVGEVMVGDPDPRVGSALGFEADGDVGIAAVVVEHVHDVGVGLAHPVDDHADELAALHVHIAIEHHQGEKVIRRGAHVGIVDDADVLFFVVAADVDFPAEVIDRVLLVFAGEGQGGGQAVLGEDDGAVEVVFVLHGIVPAAHDVVVFMGVLDDGRKALLVETVLRGQVGDGQALGGLSQRVEAEGETIGIHLAHGPQDADQFLVGNPVLLRLAGQRQGQQHEKENNLFHRVTFGFYKDNKKKLSLRPVTVSVASTGTDG